jgi:RNA polymerase sigma-70 factor (ECF subfamily)
MEKEEIFEYMNEYQIKGWFFTTIKNKNIDNIRKQKRLTFMNESDMPEEVTDFEDDDLILKDLLEYLPEANKKVVTLRYQLNLNSTEIGKLLNLSPSTVRSRLSSSMKILKENLKWEE